MKYLELFENSKVTEADNTGDNRKNILAYYKAICAEEGCNEIVIEFTQHNGPRAFEFGYLHFKDFKSVISVKIDTKKPDYGKYDEESILVIVAASIAKNENSEYYKTNMHSAKWNKLRNYLHETYLYSKFSKILWQ